ncbi:DUF1361 domain-containing protein [Microbacterium gorillae]|uniref:DUF1361 domain-containing protein n=1 Tax=Microbacterium gorillae TaxID=1231063 RepID=UPI000590F6B9|nr:DUF1361 domain-containing protein [Microbacterium gorillae]
MIGIVVFAAATLALNVYALVLVLTRSWLYRVPVYRPMVWNIALSLMPTIVLVAAVALLELAVDAGSRALLGVVLAVGGVIWLLLLPNAAYLITELNFSHRREDSPVPAWYDIVQTLTLALSGVANTLLNVTLAQLLVVSLIFPNVTHPFTRPASWIVVAGILVLVTLGMYLGRYLRVNSWDIRHPIGFLGKLVDHFRVRANRLEAFGFCLTHSILLALLDALTGVPLLIQL